MGFDYNSLAGTARSFNRKADAHRAPQKPWVRMMNLVAAEKAAARRAEMSSRFVDLEKFTFTQSLLPSIKPTPTLADSRFYTGPLVPVAVAKPEVAVKLTLKGKTDVFKRNGTSVVIDVTAPLSPAARLKAKTEVFKRNGASIVVQVPQAVAPFAQAAKPKGTLRLSRPVEIAPAPAASAAPAAPQAKRAKLSLGAKVTKAELPTFENLSSRSTLQQFASVFRAAEQNVLKAGGIEAAARPAASFSVAQKSRKSWSDLAAEAEARETKKTFADIDLNAAFRREMQNMLAREGAQQAASRPAAPGLKGMAA